MPVVHGWPLLSRHAVPPELQVVFTVSAQPAVVPALQVVAQAVELAQMRPFAHAAPAGLVQAPELSQLLAGVKTLVPVLQEAAAQAVDEVQQLTLHTCGETHWSLAAQDVPADSWLTHALLPLQ